MRLRLAILLLACGPAVAAADGAPSVRPAPPAPPEAGFGSPSAARAAVERGSLPNPLDPSLAVHWLRPLGPDSAARVPVVLFLHGFGAQSPLPYGAWLEHMAGEGMVVVYPVYPALESKGARTRYDAMWAGFEAALGALSARPGPAPDPARLGVVGHSFGGGAAPAMAARAAARGYGKDALWVECLAPWYDLDREAWAHLPANAALLTVAFSEDGVCDPSIASSFLPLATTLPPARKAFLCFRSDDHGSPRLRADHGAPLTVRGVDALDTRGLWRVDDALRAFALTGSEDARRASLGGGAEATALGSWSDGTPVAPATTAWPPADLAPSTFRTWRPGGPQETMMRRLLRPEAHSALPLPSPDVAPASRLPASERLMGALPDDPPTAGAPAAPRWPAAVESAAAKGPVLALPEGATLPPDLSAALSSLEAKGIAVVRVGAKDASALGRALSASDRPTAFLVGRGGVPLLWKPADDPHLVAAVLDLTR